ncbi:MAG: T9SS type A sorting domain-containing protein [Candidatus Cloacimonadota bacterium]|nr:T9SS type A sorting domain-containing protein [Candidatus Cloacimonadota bacterium]
MRKSTFSAFICVQSILYGQTLFSCSREQNQLNEQIELEIYNLKGQKLKTLECEEPVSTASSQIKYSTVWDGADENKNHVAAGVYFYKLKTESSSQIQKMILLK